MSPIELRGGMVTDYSGTSIFRNEFVVIGGASIPTTWGYVWVRAPNVVHVATSGKKLLKNPKYERNEMELRSFHYVMVTQRLAKSGRAANFEPISYYLSHIF